MRLALAGAGIMGRVLAFYLLQQGHRVSLFDRDPIEAGSAAAWTAAGMLAPWAELESAEQAVHTLGLRSLALWPQLVAALGEDVGFHQRGSLVVAHPGDRAEYQHFCQRLDAAVDNPADRQLLDHAALARLEPALAEHFERALWLPGEAWLDTRLVMAALGRYLLAQGAEWHPGCRISALTSTSVSIAEHGNTAHYPFDQVIDCRGLGARGDLPGLRGVRGEVLWLEAPEVQFSRPVRLLHPRYRLYLVPRSNHIYVLGATQIESDDSGPVTLRSALELLSAAYSLHAGFAEARVIHMEANCRPALDDNLPCLLVENGLIRVNGLFRHGYLLAPALAEQVLALLAAPLSGLPTSILLAELAINTAPLGEQP